jgi:hypothetical protein
MSQTAEHVGMIAGGVAMVILAEFVPGAQILMPFGVSMMLMGTSGLLQQSSDPSNIGPQGQLPVQTPNPLWRVIYGIFQFAGSITFVDGPVMNWIGTGSGQVCANQFVHRVQTLTCHQIAGFLAVVLDGQTYNFGTDLVLLTEANTNNGIAGPVGTWGFLSNSNPWCGQIFFEFDCGDPGNSGQPFPWLQAGSAQTQNEPIGSTRWTASCLQRGRSKVHIIIHYAPGNNAAVWGPEGGAPQPYVLSQGRIPIIEFKVAGRIILDYRVVTAWQPGATYPQYSYVLAIGGDGFVDCFVQQNLVGVSGAGPAAPDFGAIAPGATLGDGSCLWLNCRNPIYAAGSGQTDLNNVGSMKLGGPGGTVLIADAWQGTAGTRAVGTVIEAPIGWLQMVTVAGQSGASRPNFATVFGGVTAGDGGITWVCLGRSQYATCLPDNDGTQNQGGFSNSALCIADYLTTPRNQFGLGATLTLDSIDTVITAANVCDEPVVIEVF